MTLNVSGNLGIGNTNPTYRLSVANTAGGDVAAFTDTSSADLYINLTSGISTIKAGTAVLALGSNATERARFISDGTFIIGKTSTSASSNGSYFTAAGTWSADFTIATTNEAVTFNNLSTVGTAQMDFRTGAIEKGNISWNNTNTTYNTTSDYRLKNTITPMTGALAKVATLKPVTYKWNIDGSNGEGFIAHELAEVVPQAVTGEKDEIRTYTDEDGNEQTRPKYQGIDTSYLVATLTAAIQEQQVIIETLTQRITALEGA
jgi:hypothetical protein